MNAIIKRFVLAMLWVTALLPMEANAADVRHFYMGFSPFHYSWNNEKLPQTYEMVNGHADLIMHHFDEGVPWDEALQGKPYHQEIMNNFAYRKQQLREGQKVFVATTATDFHRKELAKRWGKKNNMDLPEFWEDKTFDDPDVIVAYTNYCQFLIDFFKPDYFSYGIEMNLMARNAPEKYLQFVVLASKVYPALKKQNPALPVLMSFYMFPPDKKEEVKKQVQPLLPYTDIYAVSTYPYMGPDGVAYAPSEIPRDWFVQLKEIAPNKPIAVSETGYVAEDFSTIWHTQKGSEALQKQYVEWLLMEAQREKMEFVVWFLVADYDDLWSVMRFMVGFSPLMRAWKDIGFFDGDLQPRAALAVWDAWLAVSAR